MDKKEYDLLKQVAQAVIGIEGNPDNNGIVGDIKSIDRHLNKLNGSVARNCSTIVMLKWIIGGVMLLICALIGVVVLL